MCIQSTKNSIFNGLRAAVVYHFQIVSIDFRSLDAGVSGELLGFLQALAVQKGKGDCGMPQRVGGQPVALIAVIYHMHLHQAADASLGEALAVTVVTCAGEEGRARSFA